MGCVIPHQSNAVNISYQTNAGLKEDHCLICIAPLPLR